MRRCLAAPRSFGPKIEIFLLVEAIYALVIDDPTVAANQHEYPPEPVSHSGTGNLMHARLQWFIQQVRLGLLVPTGSALLTHQAGAFDAHTIAIDQVADELLTLRRP